jgi:hypothetical protein
MPAYRTTAILVGVLFITATVAAIVGGALLLPLTEPDYLAQVAAAQNQMVTGALLEMVLVLAVVGIGVLMYPILRRQSEGAGLAYAGTRLLEGVLLAAASVSALVMVTLSTQPATTGAEASGQTVMALRDWTYLFGSELMLGVSALILYSLLYRARLVPVWLSAWGLIGGALILLVGLLDSYAITLDELIYGLLVAPIALQEMVLALWLILRGFNRDALEATPPRSAGALPSLP